VYRHQAVLKKALESGDAVGVYEMRWLDIEWERRIRHGMRGRIDDIGEGTSEQRRLCFKPRLKKHNFT
jgi:hypothetical protein